jgi:hypothetical protein
MGTSNEPESPIEQSLRSYAAKRRWDAGDPMTIPEETRRRLHREVARRFAQTAAGRVGWKAILSGLWPRFALGAGLAVLVLAAASIWFRPPTGSRSYRRLKTAESSVPQGSPVPRTSTLPVAVGAKAPFLAGKRPKPGTVLAEQLSAPPPRTALLTPDAKAAPALRQLAGSARPQGPAASILMDTGLPPQSIGKPLVSVSLSSGTTAPVAPALATASAASEMAGAQAGRRVRSKVSVRRGVSPHFFRGEGREVTEKGAGLTPAHSVPDTFNRTPGQRFTRIEPTAFKLPRGSFGGIRPDQGVLSSFRIQQTGPQLRIIDHDGSVYTGSLQNQAPAVRATSYGGFRVAGTNRSLNQLVIFSGDFVPLINPPAPPQTNLFPNLPLGRIGGSTPSGTAANRPVAPWLITASGTPPGQLHDRSRSNLSRRYGINPALDRMEGVRSTTISNLLLLRNWEISGKLTVGKHGPVGIHAVPAGTP